MRILNFRLLVLCVCILMNDVTGQEEKTTLITTTLQDIPFIFPVDNGFADNGDSGKCGQNMDGFLVDLLRHVSDETDLKFCFRLVADGRYGWVYNSSWNGMVKEVLDKTADLAAASISMYAGRMKEAGLEFTHPFMTSGISAIMAKPSYTPYGRIKKMFFMMSPMKAEVWFICGILAPLLTAIMLFLNNRFNPFEWNSHSLPSKDFSVPRVIYYTLASLTWQGYDRLPRSNTGRFLTTCWFIYCAFFLTIYMAATISSYSAHMHESHNQEATPISLEEMYKTNHIKYGTTLYGTTRYFFERTKIPLLQNMNKKMNDWYLNKGDKSVLPLNISAALNKVRTRDYAFFMEEHMARFLVNKAPCDLQIVDTIKLNKHFGMMIRSDMQTQLRKINTALVKLIEQGVVHDLYMKWWYDRWGDHCRVNQMSVLSSDDWRSHVEPMRLSMFSGALLLLLIGMITSVLVLFTERYYFNRSVNSGQLVRPDDAHRLDEEPEDMRT